MTQAKLHDHCTTMRRKLVTHHTLNLRTGATTPIRQEWVTEPCNTPLFGLLYKERGTCRACSEGWKTATNYPVNKETAS